MLTHRSQHHIGRRTLLRALALASGVGAVVPLLQACGGGATTTPASAPTTAAAAPAATTAPAPAPTTAAADPTTAAPAAATAASVAPTTAPAAAPTTASGATTQATQLRVSTWAGVEEQKQLQGLLDAFMAAHPSVKAKIEPATEQYRTKMLTLFAAGNGPDVLWLEPTDVLAFAKRSVILALDGYRNTAPADTGEIYPVLLKYFTIEGKLYAIPKDWFPAEIFYINKDLLAQANVKWPADTWTYPDLVSTAKALTKADGGTISRYGYSSGTAYFWWEYWARSTGGDIFDDPLNPTKFTLADPKATAGLQAFADLWLKEKVAVNPTTQDLGMGMEQGFMSQRVAIGTWGTWIIVTGPFKTIKDFKWDIALPPVAPNMPATNVLVANTYAIGHDGKALEASWEFVSFVAGSKQGQALNSRSGLAVPTMPSVANSADFKNPNIPINWDVFLKPIDYAQWGPRHTAWPEIQNTLQPALDAIWNGHKPAADAIKEVEPKVTALLTQG